MLMFLELVHLLFEECVRVSSIADFLLNQSTHPKVCVACLACLGVVLFDRVWLLSSYLFTYICQFTSSYAM